MHADVVMPERDQLFATAEGQDGYFTTAQAERAGYGRSSHSYHVKAGNWFRVSRGIYRLNRFPETDAGHLVPWWLWSRGRDEVPQGVYSHETALALHDLADANPAKLHMTVPPGFRRNAATPPVLVLHKAELHPGDVQFGRGYAVTHAFRGILDCSESGTLDRNQLEQAFVSGVSKGMITRREIREALKLPGLPSWLSARMKEVLT